jgi:hypothetical protein
MIAVATLVLTILLGLASPGAAGELCLLPSAAGGLNVSVSCPDLMIYDNDWIGFRSGGGEPCQDFGPFGMCYERHFGWSISSSSTDPFQNEADAPAGTGQLYLWLACTWYVEGLASAEFDVGGTIAVYSFTPEPGFYNIGDATHLLLGVDDCPMGPVLAGTFQVHDPIAVESETWGRIKSTYR